MVRTKEAEIADRIAEERARLLREAGLEKEVEHFRRPVERPFTAHQRGQTTILISGLTIKHEELVLGCMEGLGYKVYYYENTEGGHAAASTNKQLALRTALSYSYLWMLLK